MIKAVIFDVDDTLYNYTKAHEKAFEVLLDYADRELGLPRETFEELQQKTHAGLRASIGEVSAIHNRCIRFQMILESRGLPLSPHVLKMYDLYWDTLIEASVPSSGAPEAVRQLKERGIRIGIGTDMTARMQFKKLEALGLLPDIDFIVSSEEAGVEKPEAAFFALCVRKAGCKREECLFIGDSLKKDVQGAVSAGLKAAWYRPEGKEEREDVLQITDMQQLPELVRTM